MLKRLISLLLLVVVGLNAADTASAARRTVVRKGPHRTTVVVHRGWPLKRAPRQVVVYSAPVTVRVTPLNYVASVVFAGVVIAVTASTYHDVQVWEDGATLSKRDDWTEFTLNANSRGTKLWLELKSGRVQFDWAEVVFANGDAAVVDFKERTHPPGLYSLLDFRDGRKVDHVRVVARAKTSEARVVLRMEK